MASLAANRVLLAGTTGKQSLSLSCKRLCCPTRDLRAPCSRWARVRVRAIINEVDQLKTPRSPTETRLSEEQLLEVRDWVDEHLQWQQEVASGKEDGDALLEQMVCSAVGRQRTCGYM
jgi:hypothetical protein